MPNMAFLNGSFLSLEDAKVSVEDRGFQFGDGIYELVRVYHGVPFQLPAHLARLTRSAGAIDLPLPYTSQEWEEHILEGIRRSGYVDAKVYIQVTRGVAPREHFYSEPVIPTVVMTVRQMIDVDASHYQRGVAAITVPDIRWDRCDIKSLNLLPNVLAKRQAVGAGAFEAIFVKDGLVLEGTSSNLMMVSRQELITPPLSTRILPGVTRNLVIELARKHGIVVREHPILFHEFIKADEIMLVGTTIEILPVTTLNGQPVADGTPGPLARELRKIFQQHIDKASVKG
ncbi:MAG: D-amino-acid transaminase [Nitrospirae bacterium]|nr:MAG: D-amino-acid transaminase [Nitrospirota bacterium]